MRVAVIGRTEALFDAATHLASLGHELALVVTAREAPEYTRTTEDFRSLAISCGAVFLATPRISDKLATIQEIPRLDIAISVNYVEVIPQNIIDCFRLGILNAHGGDLPRYRGNACQAWAILNGEPRIGLCVHKMQGGELDSGDIVARDYLAIDMNTKVTKAWAWMTERIPCLFAESLALLDRNPAFVLERQPIDPGLALRCYPRLPEDGRISWGKSARDILRLINASNKPYAGAHCDLEGRELIIWDAQLADNENFLAVPGQVASIGSGYIDVTCGVGKLRIFSVEYDGQVGSADMFVNSLRQRLR